MVRKYSINREEFEKVKRSADRADIREICFAAMGRGTTVRRFIRIPNRAPDAVLCHVIESRDVEKARGRRGAKGLHLLGLLHSHILSNAQPSPGDIEGYEVGSLLFIYSMQDEEIRAFRRVATPEKIVEHPVVIFEGRRKGIVEKRKPGGRKRKQK